MPEAECTSAGTTPDSWQSPGWSPGSVGSFPVIIDTPQTIFPPQSASSSPYPMGSNHNYNHNPYVVAPLQSHISASTPATHFSDSTSQQGGLPQNLSGHMPLPGGPPDGHGWETSDSAPGKKTGKSSSRTKGTPSIPNGHLAQGNHGRVTHPSSSTIASHATAGAPRAGGPGRHGPSVPHNARQSAQSLFATQSPSAAQPYHELSPKHVQTSIHESEVLPIWDGFRRAPANSRRFQICQECERDSAASGAQTCDGLRPCTRCVSSVYPFCSHNDLNGRVVRKYKVPNTPDYYNGPKQHALCKEGDLRCGMCRLNGLFCSLQTPCIACATARRTCTYDGERIREEWSTGRALTGWRRG